MKFFAVYMKPDASDPLQTLTCVSSNFSFMASIFQGFWALYHRIWWLAAFLILLEIVLGIVRYHQMLDVMSLAVINLAIFAYVGFNASDWREAQLKHKGYTLMDVVVANNEMQAQARYLDQHFSRKSDASSPFKTEAFA